MYVVVVVLARMLVPYGLGSLSSPMDYRQLGQQVIVCLCTFTTPLPHAWQLHT